MISYPKKKCIEKDCKEIGLYGLSKKATHCETHKSDNHINLVERKCISCNLLNILDKNKKCYTCDPNLFNTVQLAKQREVKAFFDQNDVKYISYDKRLDNGVCGNERPDFVFESSNKGHFIVLEVDENQHYGRQEQCECTRMVNISQSLHSPTIFIRYNPDEYKTDKKKHNPNHNTRMKKLKEILNYAINLKREELSGFCSMRKLYFNDYKDTDTNYYSILDFEK